MEIDTKEMDCEDRRLIEMPQVSFQQRSYASTMLKFQFLCVRKMYILSHICTYMQL
jgi:hypothetical protein